MADKLLRLTWKKLLLIVGAWILCVVLHNLIYALFFHPEGDEPVFFLLAVVVIPAYFAVSCVYTVVRLVTKSRAKSIR